MIDDLYMTNVGISAFSTIKEVKEYEEKTALLLRKLRALMVYGFIFLIFSCT